MSIHGSQSIPPQTRGIEPTIRSRSNAITSDSSPVVRGLNRSISVEPSVESKLFIANPANGETPSKYLMSRSVSADAGVRMVSMLGQSPQSLMTSEGLVAEAGAPKKDVLLKKQSTTYKAALAALDQYHAKQGTGEKLDALKDVKKTGEDFLAKKFSESPSKGGMSPKSNPRVAGAVHLMESIRAEEKQLLKAAVSELSVGKGDMRPLAGKVAAFPVKELVSSLAVLPDGERIEALKHVLESLREVSHDNLKALDVVVQLMGAPGIDAAVHTADLAMVVAHGEPHENAKTTKRAFDQGVLDITLLASVAQNNTQRLGGGEMMERHRADEVIKTLNPEYLNGTQAWASVQKAGVIGSIDMDGSADFTFKVGMQANTVTIDRMMREADGDPAFIKMIQAWDQMTGKDMIDYLKALPNPKLGRAIDISDSEFIKQASKLDTAYFHNLAEGKPVDRQALGWQPLPSGWADNPDTRTSKADIVSDFFFRNAPGVKVALP